MERRVILAIVLMMIVAIAPSLIWPPKKRVAGPLGGSSDSARVTQPQAPEARATPAPTAQPPNRQTAAEPAETVWVSSPLYRLGFSTRGGVLVSAQLLQYQSFAPGDSAQRVQLVPIERPLLVHQLVPTGGEDTVSLADWSFRPSASTVTVRDSAILSFEADQGGARVTIEYRFRPDEYHFDVHGSVIGLGGSGALLVVGLSDGLRSVEADSLDDYRHYGLVTKSSKASRTDFSSLDAGQRRVLDGPFEWAGVKSKYFFAAALALEENQSKFGGAIAVGLPRANKRAARATVVLTMPVPPAGDFRYGLYLGPLDHQRLAALGHGLDDANPYGGFLRGVIHPVSIFVVNVLVWIHAHLSLAYGWVLILFGVVIRLLLWPLNQKAMESGIRMQAVAPLIKEIQERYKNDPERLQREMLRIYKEHKVNPFGGCLPMLLPMPVLLALFFVFANTIEFRGVPFLWLPDLSRHDPYFIIPIVMGLSMFGLSKVGQIGVPPNPQTKMMVYFMPVMMTMLFLNFASGLNLYYAAQNLFSIPQQYMIAKRRLREAPVARAPAKT
ncbi:MAG TPA: membrane protein insertase YidC [Gemmatimonadales bacterium]|nr:membrane protein insertase YidC [Gemmatimonadales bacterium]